jgi:hypothetical protein
MERHSVSDNNPDPARTEISKPKRGKKSQSTNAEERKKPTLKTFDSDQVNDSDKNYESDVIYKEPRIDPKYQVSDEDIPEVNSEVSPNV